VVTPAESLEIVPRVLVLATGSQDRLLPFPGWEHPSVVTVDDGLDLTRRTSARLRWVVAGIGEMGAEVARVLRDFGQDVVAYADGSPEGSMGGSIVTRVVGRDRLDEVELQARTGVSKPIRLAADYLCVAYARSPFNTLAWLSGCAMEHRADRGGYVPSVRDGVMTSRDDVLVAGDAAGLCRVETATAEGRLAGFMAAERLGRIKGSGAGERRELLEAARDSREKDGAVLGTWVSTMWNLEEHYVRGALIQPETVLCRCETVTARQVGVAVDDGALTPGDVKRMTRAGMGECQGTHCRSLIARAVSVLTGRAVEAEPPMSFRPPVRPLALAELLKDPAG
jgi:bacterioferritin-associated ferredoxin